MALYPESKDNVDSVKVLDCKTELDVLRRFVIEVGFKAEVTSLRHTGGGGDGL